MLFDCRRISNRVQEISSKKFYGLWIIPPLNEWGRSHFVDDSERTLSIGWDQGTVTPWPEPGRRRGVGECTENGLKISEIKVVTQGRTSNCQTHQWNVGSCHIIIKYPQQQLPKALGSCLTAILSSKCLHKLLGGWHLPSAIFRHGLAGIWVWKMKQKSWQGRLEGLKNSHGSSKM